MIELVAKKLASGDIYVAKARDPLRKNEWGMAYRSLAMAFSKGNLSEEDSVYALHAQICDRLGIGSDAHSNVVQSVSNT